MKKILKLLFIISSLSFSVMAQKQNNIWCFGDSALIDFSNTNNPVTGTSAIRSRGSCVSIADTSGQLLFYANTRYALAGNTTLVWNKNNVVMQNGNNIVGEGWYGELVIIPYPQHAGQYLLFSISCTGSSQLGLYYTIIDMNLNGGLGAVTQKNIQLLSSQSKDGIKAIKHGNGRDWWVIYRELTLNATNSFHVFLVDSMGVHQPLVQNVGSLTFGSLSDIVFTENGSRFFLCNMFGLLERYDFDRCSGTISNPLTIDNTPGENYWGIALSNNDSILYVSTYGGGYDCYLYQMDLTSPNILLSRTQIFLFDHLIYPNACGLLRLAPDDKIYLTIPQWGMSDYYDSTDYNPVNMNLSVINSPDSLGAACNFQPFSFYLGGKRTYWGLPNNPDYDLGPLHGSPCYFTVGFTAEDSLCPGSCTNFTNTSINGTSYSWHFPGASPDTSTNANPLNICYPNPGLYDVQLTVSDSTLSNTLLLQDYITVYPAPITQSISQTGDTLFANQGSTYYQWYFNGNIITGATNYFFVAQQSGDYNVICTDANGCEAEAVIVNVIAATNLSAELNNHLLISPNPAKDKISISTISNDIKSIAIFNMMGEEVISRFLNEINKNEIEINISGLSPGIYTVHSIVNEKECVVKFMKE